MQNVPYVYAFAEGSNMLEAGPPPGIAVPDPGRPATNQASLAKAIASISGAERIDPKAAYPLLNDSLKMLDFAPAAITRQHLQSLCTERDPDKVKAILGSLGSFAAQSSHCDAIKQAILKHGLKLGQSEPLLGSGATGVSKGLLGFHHQTWVQPGLDHLAIVQAQLRGQSGG